MNVANMVRGVLNGLLIYSVSWHPFCLPAAVQNIHLRYVCNLHCNEMKILNRKVISKYRFYTMFNIKSSTRGITASFSDIFSVLVGVDGCAYKTTSKQQNLVCSSWTKRRRGGKLVAFPQIFPKNKGVCTILLSVLTRWLPFIHLVLLYSSLPS